MANKQITAALLSAALLVSTAVQAVPFSVTGQQAITSSGQLFNFNFAGVPTSGTMGQASITLNGDYSGFASETAVVSIDIAGGILDLGFGGANFITTNTVAGLTLNSFSSTTFSFNDREYRWVFDMSDPLLASVIGDGTITTSVQNDPGVNPFAASNPDFVRVGYSYEVPEPATLLLLGFGLAALGFKRRIAA